MLPGLILILKFGRVQTGKKTAIFNIRAKRKHIGKIIPSDILKSSVPPPHNCCCTCANIMVLLQCFAFLISLIPWRLWPRSFSHCNEGKWQGKIRQNWEVIFPFQQKTSSMEILEWNAVTTPWKGRSQPLWLPLLNTSWRGPGVERSGDTTCRLWWNQTPRCLDLWRSRRACLLLLVCPSEQVRWTILQSSRATHWRVPIMGHWLTGHAQGSWLFLGCRQTNHTQRVWESLSFHVTL